jgi:hypothetical protein
MGGPCTDPHFRSSLRMCLPRLPRYYCTQTRAHVGTSGVGTILPQHTTWRRRRSSQRAKSVSMKSKPTQNTPRRHRRLFRRYQAAPVPLCLSAYSLHIHAQNNLGTWWRRASTPHVCSYPALTTCQRLFRGTCAWPNTSEPQHSRSPFARTPQV